VAGIGIQIGEYVVLRRAEIKCVLFVVSLVTGDLKHRVRTVNLRFVRTVVAMALARP